MAFSVLNVLLYCDKNNQWLDFLAQNGYLTDWLSDLQTKEGGIIHLLTPSSESTRALYVFESKLSLLAHISQTPKGAILLEKAGLLRYLESCSFVDQRPEDIAIEHNEWLRQLMERYETLLLPTLRLVAGILTALTKNEDVASQVLDFVYAHSELFSTMLKDRSPIITANSLNALILVAEIFYHLAGYEDLIITKVSILLRLFGI